jgi:hypothetical protein
MNDEKKDELLAAALAASRDYASPSSTGDVVAGGRSRTPPARVELVRCTSCGALGYPAPWGIWLPGHEPRLVGKALETLCPTTGEPSRIRAVHYYRRPSARPLDPKASP